VEIKKILVSQPKPTDPKSAYYRIAERYGVELVFRPFIKVEGLSAKEFRQQKINILDYSAIIFTAKGAINHFFRLCDDLRITMPETMKYFCTTEQIAYYLQHFITYRKRKVFKGTNGKLDGLTAYFQRHNGERFLQIVSDVHKEEDSKILDDLGLQHSKAIMYRTVSNDFKPDEPRDYDGMLFFSPAGIDSLLKNYPDIHERKVFIGTLGAPAAKAVIKAGLELSFQAPTPETPSMTSALELFLKNNQSKTAEGEQ